MIQFGLEQGARFLVCGSDTSLFLKASLRQHETFAALARR
jgi:2-keto-3-deoxy-L-rhamnonate aldolase RhmA